MEQDTPCRRNDPVLPFGFAPQVLPALQVAEWLTGRLNCRRHALPTDDDATERR